MAMPARKLEPEEPVEERVARLETHVEHIQLDVTEVKAGIRRLEEKIDVVDQKLTAKIDAVDQKLTAKIDGVDQKLTAKIDGVDQKLSAKCDGINDKLTTLALNMEKGFAGLKVARVIDRVWWLLMLGALLGIMARALKWI